MTAQIADRAGLNRATFFRHFADKREVLFGGEDVLAGLFADAVRAASPDAALTECLQAAFAPAEVAMTPGQRSVAGLTDEDVREMKQFLQTPALT